MTTYFNLITLTTVLLLATFSGLVWNNHNLDPDKRRAFLLSGLVLFVSAVTGWIGVTIDGVHPELLWLHRIVTPLEFTSAPAAAVVIGLTVTNRVNRWTRLAFCSVVVHGVLEVISAFTGFIYSIDGNNLYHREAFYWVYIAFYFLAIIYLFVQIARLGKTYQNQNTLGLVLIVVFLAFAIVEQITISGIHLVWLVISMTLVFYYCYYIDMTLRVDGLTGLLNRQYYDSAVQRLRRPLSIVVLDVNDFKRVNDSHGHAYGDECLRTIAGLLLETFRDSGHCFRIGGDEFCVHCYRDAEAAEARAKALVAGLVKRRQADERLPLVAYGIARVGRGEDYAEGFRLADRRMYENKQRAGAGR